ncbi:UNVERIFIED_CONTAM: hypothetical protein HDU68_000928 [Siphonaria sp. JEL0065]|nr:hypothetical protein HDU68_000928 [Siphonaria sp. JEL0065]
MSTAEEISRRRRLSAALGAARSPSASGRVSLVPPPVQQYVVDQQHPLSSLTVDDFIQRQLANANAKAMAKSKRSDSDSSDSEDSEDERVRRHSAMLTRIARASNWDTDLQNLVVPDVNREPKEKETKEAKDAKDAKDLRIRRMSSTTSRRSILNIGLVSDPLTRDAAAAPAAEKLLATNGEGRGRSHEPSPPQQSHSQSHLQQQQQQQLGQQPRQHQSQRKRSASRSARRSGQFTADDFPTIERSQSAWTLSSPGDDGGVRQRARERIRGKSIDFRTSQLLANVGNLNLATPPDTPDAIDAITSGYDNRLREIIMETVAARSKSNGSNDAEFIPLNDEDEIPYVNPRGSQVRAMSSPSIRMVRKRSSAPIHARTDQKSSAEDDLKSFMQVYSHAKRLSSESLNSEFIPLNDSTEIIEDEVPYVAPPSISSRNPSSSSIRMVRKRASVLQQALEHPSRSLSQALLEKTLSVSSDDAEFIPLNDEKRPTYIHPSAITARTASKASIDLLRRGSMPSADSEKHLDEDSVVAEVGKVGRVDPETGTYLNESTTDIVVTASGIVKTEKRSMSTPHLQRVPSRKSSPPSALRNFMEANGSSNNSDSPPSPIETSRRMSSNPSLIHPTLSLPRPPKKGVNNRHSDIVMAARTQSLSYTSSSPTNSPLTPTRSPLSDTQRNPLTDTTSVVFNTASTLATPPSRPAMEEYTAPIVPPRIRRESSIGIVAEQTGKALSSAFSYLSKAASTYLETPATASPTTPSSTATSSTTTTTATTTTNTTNIVSSPVPEPSHFFIANDSSTIPPERPNPQKLVSPKPSQSTLASAFAYFTSSSAAKETIVTPKPVVAPPQLYGQSRSPEKKKSVNANVPAPAYGLSAAVTLPKVPESTERGLLSGVVEDWWRKGFGSSGSSDSNTTQK